MRIQAMPLDAQPGGKAMKRAGDEMSPAIAGVDSSENFIQTEIIIHTFGFVGLSAPVSKRRQLVAAGD
jgi:hypothetical protein